MLENNNVLKEALVQYCEKEYAQLDALPDVPISNSFDKSMEHFLKSGGKRFVTVKVKKALLLLAATVGLIATSLFSVAATREPIVKFCVSTYENCLSAIEELKAPSSIEERYALSWVPDGYILEPAFTEDFEDLYSATYLNENGQKIVFRQQTLNSVGFAFDTEAIVESTIVCGCGGQFSSYKGTQV